MPTKCLALNYLLANVDTILIDYATYGLEDSKFLLVERNG